ncbi:hypothetical protein MACJ_000743 [Theileria orientalis]|uniref:Trafficking protein particle complex subunit 8 n=1 Tax=Theileria orientalis TaxID=68886 RepID=A0A976QUU5_THEOR|nr:hypothetical protein MACJ_000743 [Theileria orientalis]
MDNEALFKELVGAFCGPAILVRQFPHSVSRLKECAGTSGIQILKNAAAGNIKASAFSFTDYDHISGLLTRDLEHNLLDSLRRNDNLVSESIDYDLGHYYRDYSKWFKDWCVTLASGLRVRRHKRYKIPVERNGVFIFIHQRDDLEQLKRVINEWAHFKLSIVYLSEEYPEEFTTLMTHNTVEYCIVNTKEDVAKSPQLTELLEKHINSCYELLKWNVEALQSSVRNVKLTSKMLYSSEAEKNLGNLSLLMCEELALGKDGTIYSVIKSNLDHEILALSELLHGYYFYKYGIERVSEHSQSLNQGEESDRSTGYSVLSHFEKAIAHFNRHNCVYESFYVSILSLLIGDNEELNKLLAKNSLLELTSNSDFARSALCLELSSIRCKKAKRKNFQLVMAGHLFNQATFENLSKRCYLACIDEYEGWDVSEQHLYGLLGNFDSRFIVNSMNIISSAYENRYSNQYTCDFQKPTQGVQQHDVSPTQSVLSTKLDDGQRPGVGDEPVFDGKETSMEQVKPGGEDKESEQGHDAQDRRSETSESSSDSGSGVVSADKEIYYLKKLMKLKTFQNNTKHQLSTPISGSFQNYPAIYYIHHELPKIEGLTPFLVRVPIIYLRKNGIIGTNVKISTCYVDDLYQKLLENSFRDATWQKCMKFYNIKDHVKKDFFAADSKNKGANYMKNAKLNLSIQLLNPLNVALDCSNFKVLIERIGNNATARDVSNPKVSRNSSPKGTDRTTTTSNSDPATSVPIIDQTTIVPKRFGKDNEVGSASGGPEGDINADKVSGNATQESVDTNNQSVRTYSIGVTSNTNTNTSDTIGNTNDTVNNETVDSSNTISGTGNNSPRFVDSEDGDQTENEVDGKYRWVDCEILSQDKNEGFHMEPYEKKDLVLTFTTGEVGSFKIKGVSWKLFNCVYFWSPVYTVGKKLKNYESCKRLTLDEFISQRAIDKTLYFNVYEDRPKLKYSFRKVSDLSHLKRSVFFTKKDLEYVNYDNQLMFYTEKYARTTSELRVKQLKLEGEQSAPSFTQNPSTQEHQGEEKPGDQQQVNNEHQLDSDPKLDSENLCLFEYLNGESGLIEILLQNLENNPINSVTLRFKVLGTFKIAPYPLSYKLDSADCADGLLSSKNSSWIVKPNNLGTDDHHCGNEPGAIECSWSVINFPNVKVSEDNVTEKMYEVYMRFKDDRITLHSHSLSIYLFVEPIKFLDGIALIDGSVSLLPKTGMDLILPFKLFLKVKAGPKFTGYFNYKDSVKIQVQNKSSEHIKGVDFSINDKPVRSTNQVKEQSDCSVQSADTSTVVNGYLDPGHDSNPVIVSSNVGVGSKPGLCGNGNVDNKGDVVTGGSVNTDLSGAVYELVDIPPRSTFSFVVPIENPIQILADKHNKSEEKLKFTAFWFTLERFGVHSGNVEYSQYKLCVSVSSSHRELKFTREPVVATLTVTLQNVCTDSIKSLSVATTHDYESETMFSFIGVTRRNVRVIHPGKSVCLDFSILMSLPGVYNFSPLDFKLVSSLDDKHIFYQDNVSTIILYD